MSYLLDTHALLWWLFDDPKQAQQDRDYRAIRSAILRALKTAKAAAKQQG